MLLLAAIHVSSSLVTARVRSLVGPRGRAVADPGGCRARRRRRSAWRGRSCAAYPIVVLLVFVGGLGVAPISTPRGAKLASYASGEKRASGMSYFNIGGDARIRTRRVRDGLVVAQVGLCGGVIAMIPILLAAGALMRSCRTSARSCPVARASGTRRRDQRRAIGLLSAIIGLRSVAWFAVLAFAPLWVEAHGQSKADGNRLLS